LLGKAGVQMKDRLFERSPQQIRRQPAQEVVRRLAEPPRVGVDAGNPRLELRRLVPQAQGVGDGLQVIRYFPGTGVLGDPHLAQERGPFRLPARELVLRGLQGELVALQRITQLGDLLAQHAGADRAASLRPPCRNNRSSKSSLTSSRQSRSTAGCMGTVLLLGTALSLLVNTRAGRSAARRSWQAVVALIRFLFVTVPGKVRRLPPIAWLLDRGLVQVLLHRFLLPLGLGLLPLLPVAGIWLLATPTSPGVAA
jgi:hypothetical protein